MSEDNLIKNANMASIANEHLGKILEKKRNSIFIAMKALCKEGKHDVVSYASMLKSIIALDEVQDDIKRQINAANQREKELMNEHPNQ